MPSSVDVRLDHITKRFHEVVAVDDLSLEIERGEFFSMLGPSGCGKTTTLRMIGGFEESTSGTIYLGDADVTGLPPFKRDVNTVFQNYALFPHLTVFENVAFGLRRRNVPAEKIASEVKKMLELVELPGYEARKPSQPLHVEALCLLNQTHGADAGGAASLPPAGISQGPPHTGASR